MAYNTPCLLLTSLFISSVASNMPACLHVSANQSSALHTLPWSTQPNLGTPSSVLPPFFRLGPPLSPICPQPNQKSLEEELIGLPDTDIPRQVLVQDEFDCLNLNITTPGHQSSRSPVMVWVHGLVLPLQRFSSVLFHQGWQPWVWIQLGL